MNSIVDRTGIVDRVHLSAASLMLLLLPAAGWCNDYAIPFDAAQRLALTGRIAHADVVVLVRDTGGFLHHIGQWTPSVAYPVLFDDGYWARLFIRRYKPDRVVVAPPMDKSLLTPELARRALLAAWSEDGLDDIRDDSPQAVAALFKRQVAPPLGMVLVGPNADTGWAGAALAAGHRQPIAFLPATLPKGRKPVSLAALLQIDEAVRAAIAGDGWRCEGLWRGIDVVALAADIAYTYIASATDDSDRRAVDDALLRRGEERDAYVGRLIGSREQAVYAAMCSLFLPVERALTFSVYSDKKPHEAQYLDPVTVAACPPDLPMASSAGDASAAHWRALTATASHDLFLVCTAGGDHGWIVNGGTASTEDIPLNGPAVVHWVHSWAAADPWHPDTLAGRWLAVGAHIFYGSAVEPYLSAFRPPFAVLLDWQRGVPFVAATRFQQGPPWRLVYLGDPLYHKRAGPVTRVATAWGQSLQDEIRRLRALAGPNADGPLEVCETLALRLLQNEQPADARAVVDALLAGRVKGPRARAAAALGVLAAHDTRDCAAAVGYYEAYDLGGADPSAHLGAYVAYLDCMRALGEAREAVNDATGAGDIYRRMRAFRGGNKGVKAFADKKLQELGLVP